ncbi:MAG: hypothetical protein QW112_03685, partial [Candidatus Micrarchaeia archaeon]
MPRKKEFKVETGKREITEELESKSANAAALPEQKKKKKIKKRMAIVSIRRKESVARAIIREGKGVIR